MKPGEIIEYIEHHKIVCAVILKIDKKKLRILTEKGREVKLSIERIIHKSSIHLNFSAGKTQLVESIKQISLNRDTIVNTINLKTLWNKTKKNPTWLEIKSITKFCFSQQATEHEEAAIIRALFRDKLYFKFKPVLFCPNSKEKINKLTIAKEEKDNNIKLVQLGADWIKIIMSKSSTSTYRQEKNNVELKNILSSFYIFGKASPTYSIASKILRSTTINSSKDLFNFMVEIGVWSIDENIDILRFEIPTNFSHEAVKKAKALETSTHYEIDLDKRVDFTDKFTITIDGITTLDFDDALSIEQKDNNYLVGIHISDVAHYIRKNDILDTTAMDRICSIYMPDVKIPMFPSNLSENICSLKKNETKLAISTIVELNPDGFVIDYNIYSSIVRIDEQLSYDNANEAIQNNEKIKTLYNLAKNLRKLRIQNGATHITLPELSIDFGKSEKYNPIIEKIDRESPSKILISEMMILSNRLTAQFLTKHKIPALFRSQPEPRIKIIKKHSNSLFHNWMQKKTLRKLSLSNRPERHCILGLNAYTTATSPIRKYSDLIIQRQIKSIISIEKSYTNNEIKLILQKLAKNTPRISRMQSVRTRYWLLKYLEKKVGSKKEAIVLQKKQNHYTILIRDYMLECNLYQSSGIELHPEDLIQITIQHVDARNNVISVFI